MEGDTAAGNRCPPPREDWWLPPPIDAMLVLYTWLRWEGCGGGAPMQGGVTPIGDPPTVGGVATEPPPAVILEKDSSVSGKLGGVAGVLAGVHIALKWPACG